MSTIGRIVRFEVPDTLQSKINKESIDEMVLYHQNNRDDLEYRDYIRFLDILADMDELITDSSIVKEQEESVSDPEQRKINARIIVLHNLTLLLQKTIDQMKMKMPEEGGTRKYKGGQKPLSYSSVEEQSKILDTNRLIKNINNLNNNRPNIDTTFPDPFSSGIMSNNASQILPVRGGAKCSKRKMKKEYKGGELTYSTIQESREINKIVNSGSLINDINNINENRPYVDTTFPDPFSAGVMSSMDIAKNNLLPQLGGKKKKQTRD